MISYLYFYNSCVSINENCKYLTPIIRVKGLDKETISFNFRLDIGISNFNDIDERYMNGRESEIPIHPARSTLFHPVLFLIAADFFLIDKKVHYVGLCN